MTQKRNINNLIAEGRNIMKRFKYKFWFAVHNLIAHPLLCTGKEWADRFHDWTADKMEDGKIYAEFYDNDSLIY